MIPTFRANWLVAALLAATALFTPVQAAAQSTRDQIRVIEQEYARTHAGRAISDAQLEYYLDRMGSGWTLERVRADMAATSTWRPAQGWAAREVICSSVNSRYAECRVPFQGHAMITQQISSSPCIEGRSWGNKAGAVWVKDGCRARFGIVRDRTARERTLDCASYRGRYKECSTGFRGQVYLRRQLADSASCVEGRSWGQKPGTVWVRGNCRATFSSEGRPGARDDVGGWTRNPRYAVTCVSTGGGRQVCGWDDRYGQPRLIQQISTAACVQGRDWGYSVGGGIWVNSGCRATFGYGDVRYSDYGYRDLVNTTWVRDPNYSVTCSSTNNGRSVCTWDNRYGTPYVVERMSSSACVEGRDWGYDRNGGLWVTSGCRARFGYR